MFFIKFNQLTLEVKEFWFCIRPMIYNDHHQTYLVSKSNLTCCRTVLIISFQMLLIRIYFSSFLRISHLPNFALLSIITGGSIWYSWIWNQPAFPLMQQLINFTFQKIRTYQTIWGTSGWNRRLFLTPMH